MSIGSHKRRVFRDAPKNDARYRALLDLAKDNHVDPDRVRTLLWLLNAPAWLPDLRTALDNLLQSLIQIEVFCPGLLATEDLDWIPDVLSKLLALPLPVSSSVDRSALRKRNPFYAALLRTRASLGPLYRALQAHCFIAHAKYVRRTSLEEYEAYEGNPLWEKLSYTYLANKALFAIGGPAAWCDEYLGALNLEQSTEDLAKSDRVAIESSQRPQEWVDDQVAYIDNFLRKAYGLKLRRSNSGGSRKGRKLRTIEIDDDPEDDDQDWDQDKDESDPGEQSNSANDAMAAYRDQAIRSSKLFLYSISNLLPYELVPIEVDARAEVERLLSSDSAVPENWRLAEPLLMILIQLWIGCSPDEIVGLPVVNQPEDLPEAPIVAMFDEVGRLWFRRNPPFPDYRRLQKPAEGDRNRSLFVLIPDAADLGSLLSSMIEAECLRGESGSSSQGGVTVNKWTGKLFNCPAEHYLAEIPRLLRSWNVSGRLTSEALSKVIFSHVVAFTGKDVLAASMISGRRDRTSTVGMYYACRDLAVLELAYCNTVGRLRNMIRREQSVPDLPPRQITHPVGQIYVGKRLCPKVGAVQEMVSRLLDDLRSPQRFRASEYHNIYTLYHLALFGFSTGVRAIINPFPRLEDVSPLTRAVLVRDKDGDAGAKRRWVWLMELLWQQMPRYAQHVRSRYTDFPRRWPCFFEEEDGTLVYCNPRRIGLAMEKYLPGFPVAVHRRFTYNWLLDAGCPPENVRIWMGHSTVGDEFWAPGSTFEFAQHCAVIAPFLDSLIRELGFVQVKSGIL